MNYAFPTSVSVSGDRAFPAQILVLSSLPIAWGGGRDHQLVFSPTDPFEGILVLDAGAAETVETIIRQSNSYLVPVANLTDAPLPLADFRAGEQTPETIGAALQEVARIASVVRALPDAARRNDSPETILLARAYSRKRMIEPVYDPSVRDCVIYPVAGLVGEPGRRAERMTNAGYFTRMFFDRLHACPDCGSSRLNAREECVACRSADLGEGALLHHLLCGYRGLETEFRQQRLLVCPHCRLELRHEGVDYDRPALANVCRCCGHVAGQVSVGFVCIDCEARHDSEAIATRDFYKYALTRKGERALLSGEPWNPREEPASGPSPREAMVLQALRLHSRYGRPLAILKIAFDDERTRRDAAGPPSMAGTPAHVEAIVRAVIRETDIVTDVEDGFLVYMPETPSEGLDSPTARLKNALGASLPSEFGVRITVLRPEDL